MIKASIVNHPFKEIKSVLYSRIISGSNALGRGQSSLVSYDSNKERPSPDVNQEDPLPLLSGDTILVLLNTALPGGYIQGREVVMASLASIGRRPIQEGRGEGEP
jgi:hypothetical protein